MADLIKFLGTAGARVVVSKQLRASGGIWISLDGVNLYIDPGPGALVHTLKSRPRLDPAALDAILLSHRHLDHSGDINVMIEAMTEGTFKKKGTVFAPADALDEDPVILKYVRRYPEKIEKLKTGKTFKLKNLSFTCPIRHVHHGAETYGFKIKGKQRTISYITDGKFLPGMARAYKADIIIVSVLMAEPFNLDHLCLDDFVKLVKAIKPKTAIMTHFGWRMLAARPWEIASRLSKELKIEIIAANDGMEIKL
ncbi:MAG TPA: MBL fold metallo-hydrolase [Candidatus Omnitrophota bacterium]|nr:MBL fold metallo-hydrolase [Candidatus Omnitrophota bacterium]